LLLLNIIIFIIMKEEVIPGDYLKERIDLMFHKV